MRKRIYVLFICLIMIVTMLFSSCNKGIWIKEYPQINSSFKYSLDDSIPFSNIENAPVDNESRGFRGEVHINLGCNEAYPNSKEDPIDELNQQLELYSDDDIKLLQVYVYIGKYYNTDIPKEAFDELKEYFELIRSKDIKILLRFAYETSSSEDGPRTKNIEMHAKQIKAFINDNNKLFDETVYAVQLGMIGLWGEGHGSIHKISVKRVIEAVADMIPSNIPLMVRTPEMLEKVPEELESRFGVHDDFLVGYDHEWGMMSFEDENYYPLLNKCKYIVTDAEMPWGDADVKVDMMGVIRQCVGYGLTSLSVTHNYKEKEGTYCLEKWKDVYLTENQLIENEFPYNSALLKDGKISVYNYLKYHLGYQLVASNLKINNNNAEFMITNFGFALPYGYKLEVYVDGIEVNLKDEYYASQLTEFGQHVYSFDYNGGNIAVKMVNTRDASDTIKFFNDIEFIDGMNILYNE